MTLRYSNDPELISDILRFGPQAEVLEPPELRQKIEKSLRAARTTYSRRKS
ncbi:MAG: WYL domain-containing protein [Acidobacteriota bacterium]